MPRLPTRDLRVIHLHLARERERLIQELARVEQEKAGLFQRGVASASTRMQTALARRIRVLDQQASRLNRVLDILHKQNRVLAGLIFARECADPLDQGALANANWDCLLNSTAETIAAQRDVLAQLEAVLAVLEQPVRTGPASPPVKPLPAEPGHEAVVKSVPDGDGLKLADGTRVRYIGIDAPEISGWDGQPETGALEAKAFNAQLVLGQRVRLARDTTDTDRYGRLLRYVNIGDTFVNAEIVLAGWARALDVWPNSSLAELFLGLEQNARRHRRGLWKET